MALRIAAALSVAACVVQQSDAAFAIKSAQLGQFLTSVTFTNTTTGVLAIGGPGGVGYLSMQSVDGGATWSVTPNGDLVVPELYDTAVQGTAGVMTSDILNEWTQSSGARWNDSLSFGAAGGGRARTIGGTTGFAITNAEFNDNTNGIATSTDGGLTWTTHDAGFTDTGANFGAFIGANAWVTGETNPQALLRAPEPSDAVRRVRRLSPTRHVWTFANGTKASRWAARRGHGPAPQPAARRAQTAGYATEVRASSDGGASWKSLYRATGTGYLSGIDATPDGATLCAAFNAPPDTPVPGVAILCSYDAGASWSAAYNATSATAEVVDLRFVSQTEAWAAGGTYDGTNAVANWYHSTDGAHSWTLAQSLPAYFATSIHCVSSAACWSAVIDPNSDDSWVAAGP